ncbi:MAG TPA: ABC transporter substrate-binding protein [Stellaceae bacterium]|jgi:ABC-type nitrate/sulfonate/bicarbonate transport system substrate-binding protein|nr:ABC transporter substrate-binding protein [Stellaceae bacterium]
MYRIWVADLDSPSYFVATAAVELGFFKREGIDIEFVYNTREGPALLREGKIDFIGGPAFIGLRAFPDWTGAKLLCALAQYAYWFLAVRKDLDIKRGDLQALKGLRISAAIADPSKLLEYMLRQAGLDLARDKIEIVPPPPPYGDKGFMARNGVDAITQGLADAYWGNGMRVALGEKLGIAKLHIDLRRGDGPQGARYYSFPALTTRAQLVKDHPEVASGAIRAVRAAQKALRADPSLATGIGEKLFPVDEAPLIATLIERDAPFYDAVITREAIDGVTQFVKDFGLIDRLIPYDEMVATEFSALWKE